MKKTLVAAPLLAILASSTLAQSSVTLFGVTDIAFQSIKGDGNGTLNKITGAGSNYSSRIGFRGQEDLGGGLSAGFWLEAGINVDDGSGIATNTNNQATAASSAGGGGLAFNRRSTVSLSGTFGEIRIGRDFVPSYWNLTTFDPFGTIGLAAATSITNQNARSTSLRASNGISYITPETLGGFYGQATVALGENPSGTPTEKDGKYVGVRLGYAKGPWNVALASGTARYAAGDFRQANVGASYDFGIVRLMANLESNRIQTAPAGIANAYQMGAVFPVGSGELKFSYASVNQNAAAGNNDARQYAAGYVYFLSKRTALYTHYAKINNLTGTLYNNGRATTVPGGGASGFEVGVRHSF